MELEERMSMSGMSMPGMSMSTSKVPSPFYMQTIYWVFVFVFIGIAAGVNAFNLVLYRQRMAGDRTPSKPKNFIFRSQAVITAIVREVAYYSLRPIVSKRVAIYFPPFGPCLLIGANLILIIVLWFYALDPENKKLWETIGFRSYFRQVSMQFSSNMQ